MKREILNQLNAWKEGDRRKPLLLMGARQVGKTYILKQFAKTAYQNSIYINFEDTPGIKSVFEKDLTPEVILKALTIIAEQEIIPGSTLIIFDEIQECPNALNSLKYFCETANEYHICAAGSLLGVKLAHIKGFPVGKVNFLHLYPLSFSEFLTAIKATQLQSFTTEIDKIEPLSEFIHDKLLDYFKTYLYVGGMPEAVAEYVSSENFSKVREIQQDLLQAYNLDFAKHAPRNQIMKINQVWQSIPSQLGKENKKFIFSKIAKGARTKDFAEAIQWLIEAGLMLKVSQISTPKIPLDAYADPDCFKGYLLDVGLLGAMANISAKVLLQENQLLQEFRGSIVENYVAQELVHNHYGLYYWTSEGKAEIDFVFQNENIIYPLEVKSGTTNKKKSLRVYADKYAPHLLVRTSPMNLKKDGIIFNCPLYLIGQLNRLLPVV
ncbi:MAG: ATP-binding protein [Gammaproteobacteria bacterium]|nr:ATP-binding protein [Gammaproteobacteria bacterium]